MIGIGLLLVLFSMTPDVAQAHETEPPIRLHLIWTNDIHGHVAPEGAWFMNPNFPPPLGGGASAAAYVRQVRQHAAGDPGSAVLLVDAGDTWQGAPVGTLTEGRVMETYFDALEYDVVVPGNHEFDKGEDVAVRMSNQMARRFVCANVFRDDTGELVDWVEPYRIVERVGLRIGIIGGITPSTKDMAFRENVKGLEFGALVPAIEKWQRHLLEQEKVDLVFVVVHEGLPFDPKSEWANLVQREKNGEDIRNDIRGAMDLAHVLDGIPVIVGGHTHRGYREPWIDPVTHTMVFETFGNGSSVGHVILLVDPRTRSIVGYESPRRDGVLVTLFEDEWWPEPRMEESLRPFIETARQGLDVELGRSRVELTRRGGSNSPMGKFVTEAMREALEADLAFSNLGGLRSDLPAGEITVGDLMNLLPFGNSLVVVQLPGRTLLRIFERKAGRGSGIAQSGAEVVVDPDAPEGERVRELTIAGQPIALDRSYRVVTTDYLMDGNSGLDFLAQISPDHVEYTMMLTRAAVASYLERHSPVGVRSEASWRERPGTPRADYLRSYP